MKRLMAILLTLSFSTFAGGPYFEGQVESFKVTKLNHAESIIFMHLNGARVETNSKMVAILAAHAATTDLVLRVSSYRLDVRDITKTGVFAGSATLMLENGNQIKVTTTADDQKRITSEKMSLIRSGETIRSTSSHLEALELLLQATGKLDFK